MRPWRRLHAWSSIDQNLCAKVLGRGRGRAGTTARTSGTPPGPRRSMRTGAATRAPPSERRSPIPEASHGPRATSPPCVPSGGANRPPFASRARRGPESLLRLPYSTSRQQVAPAQIALPLQLRLEVATLRHRPAAAWRAKPEAQRGAADSERHGASRGNPADTGPDPGFTPGIRTERSLPPSPGA